MANPDNNPFSRLDPEVSERFRKATGEPPVRHGHRAIEWALFAIFGALIILSALALYSVFSPKFREVPNTVDRGIETDRINLLLIGVGGDDHPGGGKDLADALLLVSLKPSTRQVGIISVPRDLYVKVGRYGTHRLNRAHAIGNDSGYPGAGAALTMATVSEVFAQPIHGFVRIDFRAFEKVIDDLGGIDVNVKAGFYDYLFQDRFLAGKQRMNGDRALRYARYRYIIGDEGDNFAREARQQQVIDAVRERMKSQQPADVIRLVAALRTVSGHTETNLTTAQIVSLYRNFRDVDPSQVQQVSLKAYTEIFDLRSVTESGEAVRPKGGDYAALRRVADELFRSKASDVASDAKPVNQPLAAVRNP